MRSLTVISLLVFCIACQDSEFKKLGGGMEYKVVQRDAGGIPVAAGQFLKMSVVQRFGDTVLRDPARYGYEYQLMDSTQMSREAWTVFHEACAGDSLVFRVDSDSAFKAKSPSFVKHKGWLETTVKVIRILENADSVQADRERTAMEWREKHQQ